VNDKTHKHTFGSKLAFRPWHMMIEKQSFDEVNREPSKLKEDFIPREELKTNHFMYPSYKRMAKNLGKSILKNTKAALKGEVIKADKSTKEERLATCEGCIHYHTPDDRCKICGCLMKVKASLAVESCPVDKW